MRFELGIFQPKMQSMLLNFSCVLGGVVASQMLKGTTKIAWDSNVFRNNNTNKIVNAKGSSLTRSFK